LCKIYYYENEAEFWVAPWLLFVIRATASCFLKYKKVF